jgi:pimeloyl-ACP methyl ester carboxylesterase
MKASLLMDMSKAVATPQLSRELLHSADTPDAIVHACHQRLGPESYRAYLELMAFGLPPRTACTTPSLLIVGDRDGCFSVDEEKSTAKVWGSEFRVAHGMGHDLMLEPAWREVASMMVDWLDNVVEPITE